MSLEQVEAEHIAATANVAKLRDQLKEAEAWEAAVATSVRVLRRLAGLPEKVTADEGADVLAATAKAPPRKRVSRQEAIGNAAREILEREGRRIKTADFAPLMAPYGFNLGQGNPNRVTTDISNSLSRGGKNLTGSRGFGWGLAEWGDERAPGPGPKGNETAGTDSSELTSQLGHTQPSDGESEGAISQDAENG